MLGFLPWGSLDWHLADQGFGSRIGTCCTSPCFFWSLYSDSNSNNNNNNSLFKKKTFSDMNREIPELELGRTENSLCDWHQLQERVKGRWPLETILVTGSTKKFEQFHIKNINWCQQ